MQYSYNDYPESGRPPLPVHVYNPAVISDYQQQMNDMVGQLVAGLADDQKVVLRGGGGMGAVIEYLMEDGEEYVPHTLWTQAGFVLTNHQQLLLDRIPASTDADQRNLVRQFFRVPELITLKHLSDDPHVAPKRLAGGVWARYSHSGA